MPKSAGLARVRVSREGPTCPPVTGPLASFPFVPEGQPMALMPAVVPPPAGYSEALPDLAAVFETHLMMGIDVAAGGTNHVFVVTDSREFLNLELIVRTAKVGNRFVAIVNLTVFGYDPVTNPPAWGPIVVPPYQIACMLHPAGCP